MTTLRKTPRKYGAKDWVIAFCALAVCYAAGEATFWCFGITATNTSAFFRFLERTYYGVFPLGVLAIPAIRFMSGFWPWRKADHWCAASLFGFPAAFVAVHLLAGNDLRYWPSDIPAIYAPVLGVALISLSAWMFWHAVRQSKSE